jgi:hypothetical protein
LIIPVPDGLLSFFQQAHQTHESRDLGEGYAQQSDDI